MVVSKLKSWQNQLRISTPRRPTIPSRESGKDVKYVFRSSSGFSKKPKRFLPNLPDQ